MKAVCIVILLFIIGLLCCELFLIPNLSYGGLDQWMARRFGGTATLKLPPNETLKLATFKHSSLWVLTEPRDKNISPKCYKFRESSTWEIFEGTVTICEQ